MAFGTPMANQPLWAVVCYTLLSGISCFIGTALGLKALYDISRSRQRKQIMTLFPLVVFVLLVATIYCTVLIPILIVQETTTFVTGKSTAFLITCGEFLWSFCEYSVLMTISMISIKRAKIMMQMRARNLRCQADLTFLALTVLAALSLAIYSVTKGKESTWWNNKSDLLMVGISVGILFLSYGLTVVFLVNFQLQLGGPGGELNRRNGVTRASHIALTPSATVQSTCRELVPYTGPPNTLAHHTDSSQTDRIFTISGSTANAPNGNSTSPSTFRTLLRTLTPRMIKRSNSVCPEKEVVTIDEETGLEKTVKVSLQSTSLPDFHTTAEKNQRLSTDDEEQTFVKSLLSPNGSRSEVFTFNTDDLIHKREINEKAAGKDYIHRHMSVPGCVNDFSDSEDDHERGRQSKSEVETGDSSMFLVPYVSSNSSMSTKRGNAINSEGLKTLSESSEVSLNIDLPPAITIRPPPLVLRRMDSESDISVIQLSPSYTSANFRPVCSQSQNTITDDQVTSNSSIPLPPWFHRRPPPPGFCTSGNSTPSTLSRQSSRGRIHLPPLKHLTDNPPSCLSTSLSSWSTKSNYQPPVGEEEMPSGYRYRYRNRLPLQAYANCLTDYSSSSCTPSSGYPKKSLSTRPSSGNMTNQQVSGINDPDDTESDMSVVLYKAPGATSDAESEGYPKRPLDGKLFTPYQKRTRPPFKRNNSDLSVTTLSSISSSGNHEKPSFENTSLSDIEEVKVHSDVSHPWAFRISAVMGPEPKIRNLSDANSIQNSQIGSTIPMYYPADFYKHFLAHEFRNNVSSSSSPMREIVSIEELEETNDKSPSLDDISPVASCIIAFPASGSSDDDTIHSNSAQNSAGIISEDAKSNVYLSIATHLGSESSDFDPDLPRSGGWVNSSETNGSVPQINESSFNETSLRLSQTTTDNQSVFQRTLSQRSRSRSKNVLVALRRGTLLLFHLILTLLPFAILKSQENQGPVSEHFYPVLLIFKGITSIFYVLCPVAYFYANKGLKATMSRP